MTDLPHEPSWLVTCEALNLVYYWHGEGWTLNPRSAARYAYRARAEAVKHNLTHLMPKSAPARDDYDVVRLDQIG